MRTTHHSFPQLVVEMAPIERSCTVTLRITAGRKVTRRSPKEKLKWTLSGTIFEVAPQVYIRAPAGYFRQRKKAARGRRLGPRHVSIPGQGQLLHIQLLSEFHSMPCDQFQ